MSDELNIRVFRLQMATAIIVRMRAQGVSGRELARRLGVSPSRVSRMLAGDKGLCFDTLARIADALGCSWRVALEPVSKPEPIA